MQRRFMELLFKRFSDFSRTEVEQSVLLAELKRENDKLAFGMAVWDLMMERRRRLRYSARFAPFDELDGAHPSLCSDEDFRRYMDEEEWHSILCRLPLPARMLAHIAKTECAGFAENPKWTLDKRQRAMLIAQIKRRFIAWHDRHSEAAFLKARGQLTAALRRNRRDGKNGGGFPVRQ